MIAALFVQSKGAYTGLAEVDPWSEERDARLYPGPHSVVAHPPCNRWCQMAKVNEVRYGHRVGDDGGCFASALDSVLQWGGVLEHPAYTHAWPEFDLLRPVRGSWQCSPDGYWVTEVSQVAYGHPARKRTWLLYVGTHAPYPLDWSEPEPTAQCGHDSKSRRNRRVLGKREASATPPAFRDMLLGLAGRSAA